MSGMGRREFVALLGGAAAWPLAARAQHAAVPVVGFMSARTPEDTVRERNAYQRGLSEGGGLIEGQNVTTHYRWARGDYGRLPALAAEFVEQRVDVLVGAGGDAPALAAKAATTIIPVVFGIGSDPVKIGLVESFNQPGGNLTGVTILTNQMEPKRLGLLRDLVPGVSVIGALINPNFPPAVLQLQDLQAAARALGQQMVVAKASSDEELQAGFASLVRNGVGALLVASDPYFDTRRARLITFAAENLLPTMYQFRNYPDEGGLISYGPSIVEAYRQIGIYTARILKGAKPADLPVIQQSKFELVINLKTARALNLTISDNLLTLADEVIE
jgi:putative tryptophan/tyrosine transport system substrate-binding protein